MKFIKYLCFVLLTMNLKTKNILIKSETRKNPRRLDSGNYYEMVEKIKELTENLKPDGYKNKCSIEEITTDTQEYIMYYYRDDEEDKLNSIEVVFTGDSDDNYQLLLKFVNPLSKGDLNIQHAKFDYEEENIRRYYKDYKEELESMDFSNKKVIDIVKDIIKSFNTDFFEIVIKKDEEESFSFLANSKIDEDNDDGGDHFFDVLIENKSLIIKNDFYQNSFSLNVPTKENLDTEITDKLKQVLAENESLKKFSQTDNKNIDNYNFECEKINNIWKKIHIFDNYDFELEINKNDSFSKILNLKNPQGEKKNIGIFTCKILDNDLRLIFIKFEITDFENFEQSFPDGGLYNIEPIVEDFIEDNLYSIVEFQKFGGKAEKITENNETEKKKKKEEEDNPSKTEGSEEEESSEEEDDDEEDENSRKLSKNI